MTADTIDTIQIEFRAEASQYFTVLDTVEAKIINAGNVIVENTRRAAVELTGSIQQEVAAFDMLASEINVHSGAAVTNAAAQLQTAAAVDNLNASLATGRAGMGQYTEVQKTAQTGSETLEQDIKKLSDALTLQAKTFSMTALEAKFYELSMRGADEMQLAVARDAATLVNRLIREQEEFEKVVAAERAAEAAATALRNATTNLTNGLRLQAETFGMTSREAQIHALRLAGVAEKELEAAKATNKLLTELEKEQQQLTEGAALTRQYASAADQLAARQIELGALWRAGAIDLRTYGAALAATKQQLGTGWDTAAAALNPVNNGIVNTGRGLQMLGRQVAMFTTAPVVAAAAIGVNEFAKFDNAMVEAYSIMEDLDQQTKDRMRSVAMEMRGSKFSVDELGHAYYYLAAAGLNAEQSMASLAVVEQFATAGAFGLERATELLMDSQSVMGLVEKDAIKNRENMIRVSDALNMAGAQSTASTQQFAEALGGTAGSLALYGVELETAMALLDAYASKNNKGVAAGSDLARALRLTGAAVRENGAEFERMGIRVIDEATGEYANFIQVIGDMERAFEGMTGPQRAAALELLGFETLAQNAILPLIGMSNQMKIWEEQQKNAAGFTEKVAAKQMESFTNKMLAFWNEAKKAALVIGENLVPVIVTMTEFVGDGLAMWQGMSGEMQRAVIATGAVVGALGAVVYIGGSALVFVGSLSNAVTVLTGANAANSASLTVNTAELEINTAAKIANAAAGGGAAAAYTAMGLAMAAGTGIMIGAAVGYTMLAAAQMEVNAAAAQSLELQDQWAKGQQNKTTALLKDVDAMADDAAAVARLKNELTRAEAELGVYEDAVTGATQSSRDAADTWRGWVIGTKEQETALKNAETALQAHKEKMERLRTAMADREADVNPEGEAAQARAADEMAGKVEELTEKLRQEEAAFGMTTAEAKVNKLAMEGAGEAQLAEARALAESIKQKKLLADAEREATQATESNMRKVEEMRAAAETYDPTKTSQENARAAEIYRLALRGASDEQLAGAKVADLMLSKLEEESKIRQEVARQEEAVKKMQAQVATYDPAKTSTENARAAKIYEMELAGVAKAELDAARAADQQLTALEKKKKAIEDAKQVTEQYRDPTQKLAERQAELRGMLEAGMITVDVYTNAMKAAEGQMRKDYSANFRINGIETLTMGSQAALVEMEKYRKMLAMMAQDEAGTDPKEDKKKQRLEAGRANAAAKAEQARQDRAARNAAYYLTRDNMPGISGGAGADAVAGFGSQGVQGNYFWGENASEIGSTSYRGDRPTFAPKATAARAAGSPAPEKSAGYGGDAVAVALRQVMGVSDDAEQRDLLKQIKENTKPSNGVVVRFSNMAK